MKPLKTESREEVTRAFENIRRSPKQNPPYRGTEYYNSSQLFKNLS